MCIFFQFQWFDYTVWKTSFRYKDFNSDYLCAFETEAQREHNPGLWSLRKWAERVKPLHHLLTQIPFQYFPNNKIKAASLLSQGRKLFFPVFAQHIEGHLCFRDAISIWVMNDKKGKETGAAYSSIKKTKQYVLCLTSRPSSSQITPKDVSVYGSQNMYRMT